MKEEKKVAVYKTEAARSRGITQLSKDGYNYFVVYNGKKGELSLQFSKSESEWVKKYSVDGIYISGKKGGTK